jgi:hypothetical protein
LIERHLALPASRWRISGRDTFDDEECTVVDIASEEQAVELKTPKGVAVKFTPVCRVYFSVNKKNLPVFAYRSAIYATDGGTFSFKNPNVAESWTMRNLNVYGDTWFPSEIIHEEYLAERNISEHFDEILESLAQDSGMNEPTTLIRRTRFEILKLSTGSSYSDLWITAPLGSLISDNDNSTVAIEGKTPEQSLRILGLEPGELEKEGLKVQPKQSKSGIIFFAVVNVVLIVILLRRWNQQRKSS